MYKDVLGILSKYIAIRAKHFWNLSYIFDILTRIIAYSFKLYKHAWLVKYM
jgi:hypothetical protein